MDLPVPPLRDREPRIADEPTAPMRKPRPTTLAELLDQLSSHQDLNENRRRDLASAVRRFCRLIRIPPSDARQRTRLPPAT